MISFGIIGAAFVVFGAALYFLANDMAVQTKQIVLDRNLISERAAIIGVLADLKSNASQADRYRQAMDKILVKQDQLIDFPRWLEGLARSRGITFTFSFNGDPAPPTAAYPGYIGFSLSSGGSFGGLLDFLKDAESRSPQFLIDIASVDLNGGGSNYLISMSGRVFFK